jgi:glycosyltransferase involved in cell wall biosynthesis
VKVSFVIPAYNAESTIRAAVESALGQTYPAAEAIVVDDCSTDGTVRALEGIADPRRRVLTSAENRGPAAARNAGIGVSDADLIACLDADDVAVPSRLALQVPVFLRNQRAVLVCGSAVSKDEAGARVSQDRSPSNPGSLAWALRFRNPVITSTATFRRTVALKIGGFPETFRLSEDHALWLALAGCGEIVPLSGVVATRTVHRRSLTALHAREMERMSIAAALDAIAQFIGCRPGEDAYRVLRCGAGDSELPEPLRAEATATWSAVFDALQIQMTSGPHRRGVARESLNELRRLLRAWPTRRFDVLRRTVGPRKRLFLGAVPSVEFLKLMRTVVEGR